MSSLAPAREAAGPRARHDGTLAIRLRTGPGRDGLVSVAVAAVLALLAFSTKTGGGISPDTADVWSQIVLVLAAAGAGVGAVLAGMRVGRGGRRALLAGVALVALSYASIAWSVQPAISWFEGDRTLSYLAAFAIGLIGARAMPSRWPALLGGVALYTLIVCGWALLCRVFPAAFDASRSSELGRLGLPFGYFNATGLVAALGIPAWLWLGTRDRDVRARADAVGTVVSIPVLALLVTTLLMSYSRGALAAAIIGCGVWFAVSPRRLSGALVLGLGAVGGLAVGLWATGQTALSRDYVWLAYRVDAGHRLGIVLIVAIAVLTLAGVATVRARSRIALSETARRRINRALVAGLALVPVLVIVALAASSRGFSGEVSHLWSSLTNPHSTVSDAPGRLTELGSSRPRYWGDGLRVASHAPIAGVGAGGFAVAVRHYAADRVTHAHSYVIQTFADLGVIGVLVSAAFALACALAWRRAVGSTGARGSEATVAAASGARGSEATTGVATGAHGSEEAVAVVTGAQSRATEVDGAGLATAESRAAEVAPGALATAEPRAAEVAPVALATAEPRAAEVAPGALATAEARTGIGALVAVAVVFGVHSAIDWTWFIPGCAVPALLCAGWAVGWRHSERPAGARARDGAAAGAHAGADAGTALRARLTRGVGEPLRAGAALGLIAVALLAAWFTWQPLRSVDAQSAAEDALLRGAAGQALTDARTAASAMPVDAQPHELLASILGALGRPAAARGELLQATRLQPENPDPWFALGQFDAMHRLPGAQAELARAHTLDPYSANR